MVNMDIVNVPTSMSKHTSSCNVFIYQTIAHVHPSIQKNGKHNWHIAVVPSVSVLSNAMIWMLMAGVPMALDVILPLAFASAPRVSHSMKQNCHKSSHFAFIQHNTMTFF